MGSHHTGPEYPGDQYPQDDQRYPRSRQPGRERREQDPGSPYGRREETPEPSSPPPAPDSGRGGYGGAPTNPYAQQNGGGYREEPTGRHGTLGGGDAYQPPRQEPPRRRRRYAEEEAEPAQPPVWPEEAPPASHAPSHAPSPSPSQQTFGAVPVDRDPYHPDLADGPASVWNDDQSTKVFSHLGYVPRPERRRRPEPREQDYAPSMEAGPDDKKFKTLRRAKRASGKTKALIIGVMIIVLAGIGGGVWWLVNSPDDGQATNSGDYAVLDKPCSVLDTSAVSDYSLTEDESRHRESSEPKGDGAEQTCSVAMNGANNLAVDIAFQSRVYDSAAKARNDWEFKLDQQKTEPANGWKLTELSGVGTQAFSLLQSWDSDADAVNYRIHLWDGNVSIEAALTVYSQETIADDDVAARLDKLVKAYLAKWKA